MPANQSPVTLRAIKSSNIHSIGYDATRRELHVKFLSGAEGHYNDVPAETYSSIMKSKSRGSALYAMVTSQPKRHPWIRHETGK